MKLQALVVLLAILVLSGLVPSASAAIGTDSKMTVETQTQMLLNQGGGYVNWEVSGPAATELRRCVDRGFGDGDGNVTPVEAQSYTNEVDLVLENYISYGSARIIRSSLLNKDINTDTAGLIGPVNSSKAVEIHFTFSANLRVESGLVDFGDQRIPQAAFRALKGEANQTFGGQVEWRHTEIVVGMASFSGTSADRGSFSRFRGPGFEVLWYSLSVKGQNSTDRARFDTFNVVQCPLELFVVVCVFGAFTLWFPRHFMKAKKMLRYRWLHLGAVLLVAAAMALFFLGADGMVVWLLAPLFAVLSFVLSWGVYSAKWKGLARSAVPALPPRPAEEARPASPISQVISARRWADNLPVVEGTAVDGGPSPPDGPPLSGPAGGEPAPARPAPPAPRRPAAPGPPQAAAPPRRDLRCPRCKGTFPVVDPGTRPLQIKCTLCGAEGVLRK